MVQLRALENENATKDDVLQLLGPPAGGGGALLPPRFSEHDVWQYFETETRNARSEGGVFKADADVRILLVLFADDRLSGYLWWGAEYRASPAP